MQFQKTCRKRANGFSTGITSNPKPPPWFTHCHHFCVLHDKCTKNTFRQEVHRFHTLQDAECPLIPPTFVILQNVKRTPHESRICSQKGGRWQIRDSRAPKPGQLVSGKRPLLDRRTPEGKFVRKIKRGMSATAPFSFLSALLQESFPRFK